jgi:ribokinase
MVRVCCSGHVNWDVTLYVDRLPAADGEARIDRQRAAGGGSAANAAAALSSLGVDSGVVGAVGDDENGHLARRELARAGVDRTCLHTADCPTTVKYLLVAEDGEVAVLGNDGANEAVAPDDVDPDYVRAADHVHLTSQRPDTAARLATVANDVGVPVSFDPGRRLPDRAFDEVFARADLVFVNEYEADALDGDAAADATLVVKRGADGATARTPDGSVAHPGFDVDPADTAGAGDAFAAGFLAARLDGADDERALAFANACGALAAREEGARASFDRAAVEALLAE